MAEGWNESMTRKAEVTTAEYKNFRVLTEVTLNMVVTDTQWEK